MRRAQALTPVAALAFGVLAACGPAKSPVVLPGTVEFRFTVSSQAKSSPNLTSPLKGTAYGDIFLSEDVSLSGPRDGSERFGSVKVEGIDLTAMDVSTQSFVSMDIPTGLYTFLGMLDVNATGDSPDSGDPVTIPVTNQFMITSGQQTKKLIVFDLIYN